MCALRNNPGKSCVTARIKYLSRKSKRSRSGALGSWAVTQGRAAHKPHEQPLLPGTQKHRWRGPGRGRAFAPGARGSVRALSWRPAPENPATANPRCGKGETGALLPACAGPFPKGSGGAQEAPWKLLGAPALVLAGKCCCQAPPDCTAGEPQPGWLLRAGTKRLEPVPVLRARPPPRAPRSVCGTDGDPGRQTGASSTGCEVVKDQRTKRSAQGSTNLPQTAR